MPESMEWAYQFISGNDHAPLKSIIVSSADLINTIVYCTSNIHVHVYLGLFLGHSQCKIGMYFPNFNEKPSNKKILSEINENTVIRAHIPILY